MIDRVKKKLRVFWEKYKLEEKISELEAIIDAVNKGEVDMFKSGDNSSDSRFFVRNTADHPYRLLVENLNDGALIVNETDELILYHNQYIANLLEYKDESISGKSLSEIIASQYIETIYNSLNGNSDSEDLEIQLKTRNGSSVPVGININRFTIDRTRVFSLLVSDLRQKHKQEQLISSEKLWRSIFEKSTNAFLLIDQQNKVLLSNRKAKDVFGEDVDQNDFKDTLNKELSISGAKQNEGVYDHLTDSEVFEKEITVTDSNGQLRYCLWNSIPLHKNDRAEGRLISLYDFTERKKIEEKLKHSLDLLNEAQAVSHVGHWEVDIVQNRLYWSDEIYRIFGLEQQEFKATLEAFFERVHPEDRDKVDKAYKKSLKNRTRYNIDHRIIKKDGSIKFVREFCKNEYDKNGKPLRSIGMVLDITESREKELALKESRAIIQAAMDHSPAGIAIADPPDGKLRYVNKAGLSIRGKPPKEIVSNITTKDYPESWQIYHRDKTLYKEEEVPLARAVLFGEKCKKDFLIKRDDGEFRYVLAEAAPIFNEKKEIISAIVIFLDISDLKEKEEELQKYHEKMEQLVEERTLELKKKVQEIQELNKLFVGREFRINELKEEIKKLKKANAG